MTEATVDPQWREALLGRVAESQWVPFVQRVALELDSIGQLERKLGQFASGTHPFWSELAANHSGQERWTLSERQALFEQVRALASEHGVIVQRELIMRDPQP